MAGNRVQLVMLVVFWTEKMRAHGVVVTQDASQDEAVPDGVRERDDSVTFEEYDAHYENQAACSDVVQASQVLLQVKKACFKFYTVTEYVANYRYI